MKELTSRDAVLTAVQQCDVIDPGAAGAGFTRAFVLELDGKYYHAEKVASLAYKVQHPDRDKLPVSALTGEAAARRLSRLGFASSTTTRVWPPLLGAEYSNRTAIRNAFGGNGVAGITTFLGGGALNIFSDEEGPYADEPPDALNPFEYRGEGREGNQKLLRGNLALDTARRNLEAVRYWYRPAGGTFKFTTWVAILSRTQVWSPDNNKKLRLEYAFQVMAVPGPELATWPDRVRKLIDDGDIKDTPPPQPPAKNATSSQRKKTYQDYLRLIDKSSKAGRGGRKPSKGTRNLYPRSRAVRDAVLVRADGDCENDRCTGMPFDTAPGGKAILEVDHVDDLALSGLDHPSVMIALCPNCHAAKTRGANRAAIKRRFRDRAAELHRKADQ
ncbi:HNH endonuclease signature motif containing protein [Amycolatopsis japonica]|uniref:HNH endonuclease signature motif containing protein n=1 Tax=Amycolatopsis japonica TaxID=208439 RepID=UPI0011DD531A|nr:HNH endonuclease signature motif containing protein [Amycolatopsis japonica]